MRLQPVPAHEIDDWWPRWWRAAEPRFRPTPDSRLSALRRHVYEDAMAAIKPGRPVKVTTYVFAGDGADPDTAHALLAKDAHARGWIIHREQFTDTPTDGPLTVRPQFHLACRRAAAGFVDGVLATSRGAMPSSDAAYEAYLRWLHRHYAFIAFMQPTHRGAP